METVFRILRNYRWWVIGLFAIIWIVAGMLASNITVQEDISKAFPSDSTLAQYRNFYKRSPLASKIVIGIGSDNNSGDKEEIIDLGRTFIESLDSSLYSSIDSLEFGVDSKPSALSTDFFLNHLPLLLAQSTFDSVLKIQTQEKANENVKRTLDKLMSPEAYALRDILLKDPAGFSTPLWKELEKLNESGNFKLIDDHLFTADGNYILAFISPVAGRENILIENLYQLADDFDGEVILFGGPVIAYKNSHQIRKDTTLAGIVAVVLILLLLLFYYHKWSIPLVFFLPPLFGMTMALAIIYLIKGEISVITLGAGTIVLGIALDYCFHTLTHIRHGNSIVQSLKEITWPLILSCFTTVLALLSLLFLDSEILNDFGLLSAFSLLATLVFVLVALPLIVESLKLEAVSHKKVGLFVAISLKIPTWLKVVGIVIITLILGFYAGRVEFEDDLNAINFFPEELQQAEETLTQGRGLKSVFILSTGKDLQEAIDNNKSTYELLDSLKREGQVKSVISLNSFLPDSEQLKSRMNYWNNGIDSRADIVANYRNAATSSGMKESAFDSFYTMIMSPVKGLEYPHELMEEPIFANLLLLDDQKVELINVVSLSDTNMGALRSMIESSTNSHFVDKASMANSLIDVVKDNFNLLLIITTSLVFITLLINYGRIEIALLTFLPMIISWLWILGICGLTGIKFNFVNVVVTTFIFGLGDDFCIFVSDGLLSRYKTGTDKLKSYKSSIILSTTTTIIGTGVLLFARHPALYSIASLSVIGMICISVISLTIQPIIFDFAVQRRKEKGLAPLSLFIILTSIISFGYFALGCVVMTLLLPVFYIFPAPSKLKKRAFNFAISKFAGSVIYLMVNVRKQKVNLGGEDFKKPAVIIANHQSFVDILALVMLHPRILILTNSWVWNSPLFGWVVRYAGYPTAEKGMEENLEYLGKCIEDGYSIAIFPEGTRSVDGKIHRFHKGAFYLAEKYKLDIIPVLLHGFDYTIRKTDYTLLSGFLTIKILPRIKPDDSRFSGEYSVRTKQVARYMRAEMKELVNKVEDARYHRDAVMAAYIYKGPVLEWYVRIKLWLESNFKTFDELCPDEGLIVDLGCGYGYLSYMLRLTSAERKILGVDFDSEKIEIAKGAYLNDEETDFISADLLEYRPPAADCYIIKDVLHYLPLTTQIEIVEHCCSNLKPGGKVIIRDGFAENSRHRNTEITEVFSTRLLGFNQTTQGLQFIERSKLIELADRYQMSIEAIEQHRNTSNETLVLKRLKDE